MKSALWEVLAKIANLLVQTLACLMVMIHLSVITSLAFVTMGVSMATFQSFVMKVSFVFKSMSWNRNEEYFEYICDWLVYYYIHSAYNISWNANNNYY